MEIDIEKLLAGLGVLYAIARIVAPLTPNKTDDAAVAIFKLILDFIMGNHGYDKNAEERTPVGETSKVVKVKKWGPRK